MFYSEMSLKKRVNMILQMASFTPLPIPTQLNHQNYHLYIWEADLSNLIHTKLRDMKHQSFFPTTCRTLYCRASCN